MKGLVLAGGESRRFGRNKALVVLPGKGASMLEIALALLSENVGETWVSCRSEHVPGYSHYTDRLLVDDSTTAKGPAAGLKTAFEKDAIDPWFVLACDYPNVDNQCVSTLLQQWTHLAGVGNEPDALLYYADDKRSLYEPLVGIWSCRALKHLSKPDMSPQSVLEKVNTFGLVCPEPEWLLNVNTSDAVFSVS